MSDSRKSNDGVDDALKALSEIANELSPKISDDEYRKWEKDHYPDPGFLKSFAQLKMTNHEADQINKLKVILRGPYPDPARRYEVAKKLADEVNNDVNATPAEKSFIKKLEVLTQSAERDVDLELRGGPVNRK